MMFPWNPFIFPSIAYWWIVYCGVKIYVAPSKALVQEKLRDWTQKLGPLGISCLELTGDNEYYNIKNIQDADIILTTPEVVRWETYFLSSYDLFLAWPPFPQKFDAVTRYRIKDGGLSFFSDISLVLIDEVHLLNDPRGAALEAIVSRIKMLSCKPEMKSCPLSLVRFLAVSATIPNINDLGNFQYAPWLKWFCISICTIQKKKKKGRFPSWNFSIFSW